MQPFRGPYPHISLTEARSRRDAMQKQRALGIDPSESRRAERLAKEAAAANTFEAVAREWYGKQVHTWSASHTRDVQRRLESNIFPVLGKRPTGEIEAPELLKSIRRIESRGSYDLAHRVLQVCGQIFRFGVATGRCSRDLSSDLRGALTPHVKQNQPAVPVSELPALVRAISAYDRLGSSQVRISLQLLLLTAARTGELIGAEWSEFDFDNAAWTIPAERMKMRREHIVPLSRQAIAKLTELRAITGHSRFILPGRDAAKTQSNGAILMALRRMGYGGMQTGHGFRSLFSTIANESGLFQPNVIEAALAHLDKNAVRAAYNRSAYLAERKKLMAWWADRLDASANGGNIIHAKFGTA
ncbi:MAG TPA: tyrosine-type recombinase/integrase [Acidobacteriaceae bacterium]|nr:tyrosine-type recombinase/integrase [Acidobacteriaceae bacterium]